MVHARKDVINSANAWELGRLVVEGHGVAVDGGTIPGRLLSVAVHPRGHVPPFDTVAQAAIAVAPVPWPNNVTEIDSGYVIVDTAVAYSVPRGVRRLTISSQLAPGALGETATVNLVVDHRDGDAVYYRATGRSDGVDIGVPERQPALPPRKSEWSGRHQREIANKAEAAKRHI